MMRVLDYGTPADYANEYLGEDTTMEFVRRFCMVMIYVYGPTFLASANKQDIVRLMVNNEARGWSGMVGSIDCMHWT
jgi:hypothetical protein